MIDLVRMRRQVGRLQPGPLLPLSIACLAAAATVLLTGAGSANAGEDECPSSNPPNMLAVAAGNPQTAQLGQAFETNLQVALANSNGCPLTGQLAGVAVDFSAPANGASGTFATSGTNRVTVGTDATGVATAPTFSANDTAGSYTVQASSNYGRVLLSLTNTASGVPASIAASGPESRAAAVNSLYGRPLRAQVLDANGSPVQGVSVTFSLGAGAGDSGGAESAGASFLDGTSQATASTNSLGQATSPPFIANSIAGRFTASAAVAGRALSVRYALRNLAGSPTTIIAGGGSGQSAPTGARFSIRLAVTVSDANGNEVAGATVAFTAPARGPSGHFASHPAGSPHSNRKSRTVRVKTNGKGVAIAPAFTANHKPGGYIVIATTGGRRAAFALVNRPRGT
jgi:hypothetical protein